MAKSIFQVFGTNVKNEVDGVWIEYNFDDETKVEFKVARAGGSNPRWNAAIEKHTRQMRRVGKDITKLTGEAQRKLNLDIYTDACLVDWRGDAFKEMDGTPIPYSRENARRIFTQVPEFLDTVMKEALATDNFKDEEGEVKNSSPS